MKRRMIVCITLAAILLVVGAAYWAFCRLPHLTGSTIKNADSYILDAQYMNGTDGHTMMLNAGDMLYAFATKRQGKSRKNSLACV